MDQINELFPEHDVTELRQALSLQLYANLYGAMEDLVGYEQLIEKHKEKAVVRTRFGLYAGIIEPFQRFRSEKYRDAVYQRLKLEFVRHNAPSTIKAVLSEHNYDYDRAKIALGGIFAKKTLWSMFRSMFAISKEQAEKQLRENPLTGCKELDDEIIAIEFRLRQKSATSQIANDIDVARKINEEEHVEADAMTECACCFGDYTWEDIISCNGGHLVCRGCVTHTAEECAFGQGDTAFDGKGLKCIAVSNDGQCHQVIPVTILERVLSSELMGKLTTRMTSMNLETSNLDLVCCPFCPYAEFKDSPPKIRLRPAWGRSLRGICVSILFGITLAWPIVLGNLTIPLIICIAFMDLLGVKGWDDAVNKAYTRRHARVQEGAQTFKCLNKDKCGRESCLQCCKEWAAFHDCMRDEKDGLRLYVEKAMADAVKRTVLHLFASSDFSVQDAISDLSNRTVVT